MSPRGPSDVIVTKMGAGAHGWKGAQPTATIVPERDILPETVTSAPANIWWELMSADPFSNSELITDVGGNVYGVLQPQAQPPYLYRWDVPTRSPVFVANFPPALVAEESVTTYFSSHGITTDGTDLYVYSLSAFSFIGFRLSRFWKYEIGSATWTQLADPIGLTGTQAGAHIGYANGAVYLFGGRNEDGSVVIDTVTKYDIGSDTWSTVTSSPIPLDAQVTTSTPTAIADDRILLFDNETTSAVTIMEVYEYSAAGDSWMMLGDRPGSGAFAIGTLGDGRIVLVQQGSDGYLWFYDESSDTFTLYEHSWALADMAQLISGVALDTDAYLIGFGGQGGLHNTEPF